MLQHTTLGYIQIELKGPFGWGGVFIPEIRVRIYWS